MTGICRNVSHFRTHLRAEADCQFSFPSPIQNHVEYMECRRQDDSADPLACVCWSRGWSFPAEVTPLTRLGFRVSLFCSAWKLHLTNPGLRGLLIICSFLYMELCLVLSSAILSCLFYLVCNISANWMDMSKVCCFSNVKLRKTMLVLDEDMTSGVIHLILDHAPVFLPVLGGARSRQSNSLGSTVGGCWRGLSGGFRYHHEDPTAICRISWFEYASHTHLLAVVVLCLGCNCLLSSCFEELSVTLVRLELRLAPHSRGLRFFWVWGLATWQHFKLFRLGSTTWSW